MEHTPAPWISTEEGDANFYFVMAPDKQWLMRIQQNGELMLAEQRQNMKLICTAPELLKALEEAKVLLEVVYKDTDSFGYKAVINAIKKATE